MPKIKTRLPKLGEYLARERKRMKLTQKAVAVALAARGIDLGRAGVVNLELGMVADPKAAVLRALADCYGIRYRDIVQILIYEKYGELF